MSIQLDARYRHRLVTAIHDARPLEDEVHKKRRKDKNIFHIPNASLPNKEPLLACQTSFPLGESE